MPARVTSSANRSKRKTTKPVSTDKGRKARARVSNAKPTSSENRARTGTARVTGSGGRGAGAQRAVDRRQEANRRVQSARAQRANAGAKPAPAAAKPAAQARGGQPKLTNLNKPTMQKLVRKAAQSRKAAAGRPLVKPAEAQRLMSQRAPKIREGAAKLRVPGDSGQARAREVRYRQQVAQNRAQRGARQASQRMESLLRGARTLRNVVRGVTGITRGGAAAAGLQAYNTGDGTLTAAKARGDLNKRRQPTPQEAQTYRQQEQKARAKNAQRRAAESKNLAASFDDAFKDARRAGVKTFTWKGKKYTTDVK